MKVEKNVKNVEELCRPKREGKYWKYCNDVASGKADNYVFTFETNKEYRSKEVYLTLYVKRNWKDVVVFTHCDKEKNEYYLVLMKKPQEA